MRLKSPGTAILIIAHIIHILDANRVRRDKFRRAFLGHRLVAFVMSCVPQGHCFLTQLQCFPNVLVYRNPPV